MEEETPQQIILPNFNFFLLLWGFNSKILNLNLNLNNSLVLIDLIDLCRLRCPGRCRIFSHQYYNYYQEKFKMNFLAKNFLKNVCFSV